METHWSSEPDGNLMMNLDPVFSSVSLRGRNLQITLMESSLESAAAWASLSSAMLEKLLTHSGIKAKRTRAWRFWNSWKRVSDIQFVQVSTPLSSIHILVWLSITRLWLQYQTVGRQQSSAAAAVDSPGVAESWQACSQSWAVVTHSVLCWPPVITGCDNTSSHHTTH